MPKTFATNENNDIFIAPNGNLSILTGLAAVGGACLTASKAQLGEMVLSINNGIPNFQTIWKGSPNIALWESYLRRTLLSVEDVIEVVQLTTVAQNNQLQYTAKISSTFGPLTVNA